MANMRTSGSGYARKPKAAPKAKPAARPARSNKGGATRGKARAAQVKSLKSTSSAASKFSKAQKKSYATMNRRNTAKVAANQLARSVTNRPARTSRNGLVDAIGNSNPIDMLYKNISDAIRRATGG